MDMPLNKTMPKHQLRQWIRLARNNYKPLYNAYLMFAHAVRNPSQAMNSRDINNLDDFNKAICFE
jgi:hypothetical protein